MNYYLNVAILKIKLFILFLYVINFFSCNNRVTDKNYHAALQELHKIECEHLVKAGKSYNYNTAYEFRSAAFQEVLKNPDRVLLAHYEDLYAELARKEFEMNNEQRKKYYEDIEIEYKKSCE